MLQGASSYSPGARGRGEGSTRVVVPRAATAVQGGLAWVIAKGLRLVAATLRYRVNGGRGPAALPETPVIFALWHNRLALCMKVYESFVRPGHERDHLAALISASRDGALLAAILRDFGVEAVRGSSSRRGPQALLELTSWAERGYDLAVTPDGPRGPRYVVQEGVLALAQITGLPIVPYSCRLGWKIRLRSWDRFEVPLPFASCQMTFGDPIHVPRNASDAERELLRDRLQDVLRAGTRDDGAPGSGPLESPALNDAHYGTSSLVSSGAADGSSGGVGRS